MRSFSFVYAFSIFLFTASCDIVPPDMVDSDKNEEHTDIFGIPKGGAKEEENSTEDKPDNTTNLASDDVKDVSIPTEDNNSINTEELSQRLLAASVTIYPLDKNDKVLGTGSGFLSVIVSGFS